MAKSRVKPLRENTQSSVPKLELLACVIASKIKVYLQKVFAESRMNPPLEVHLWSDSQSALGMIHTERILKRFENNCVETILQNSSVNQWHYCPSKLNSGDLTTRGVTANCLSTSSLWWHGPSYLLLPKVQWPQWKPNDNLPVSVLFFHCEPSNYLGIHNVVDINRFSRISVLLRVTSYVVRFVRILLKSPGPTKGPITRNEIQES